MKKKNKVLSFLIFVGLSVLFLALLYFFIGKGILADARRGESEFRAGQAKLQESQDLVRSLPNAAKAAEEIQKQDAELKGMVFNKKQLPKIIQALGRMAVENKLDVVTVRPREDLKDPDLSPGVAKVYVELVLYCEYRNLAEFIRKMDVPPYPFSTESLSLMKRVKIPGESTGSAGPLEADLVVSTVLMWE